MHDEGLADVEAANPFRLPRFHPGIRFSPAVAPSLLVTAYHVLAHQTTDRELGADYYDRRHTERLTRRALQTLEQQGYRVTLERAA